MTSKETLTVVRAWFERAEVASMELPDGWFGRPYEGWHDLTWSTVRDDKLFLELESQLHLILIDPVHEDSDDRHMDISGTRLLFDWREYGSATRRHTTVYREGGIIRFHARRV